VPGVDGLAVVREARRLFPDLPVVIITGYSSKASALEAINLGPSTTPAASGGITRDTVSGRSGAAVGAFWSIMTFNRL
jgi:ActR/RegA family two-component response regulator